MASQINPSLPVNGRPTTPSVRSNFEIARDEISALQARIGDEPPDAALETSLVVAWRDENGVLQPLGRVMIAPEPDPTINGGLWLYLMPTAGSELLGEKNGRER